MRCIFLSTFMVCIIGLAMVTVQMNTPFQKGDCVVMQQ